jgi:hypothetical protein
MNSCHPNRAISEDAFLCKSCYRNLPNIGNSTGFENVQWTSVKETQAAAPIVKTTTTVKTVPSTERACFFCRNRVPNMVLANTWAHQRIFIPPTNRCSPHHIWEDTMTFSVDAMLMMTPILTTCEVTAEELMGITSGFFNTITQAQPGPCAMSPLETAMQNLVIQSSVGESSRLVSPKPVRRCPLYSVESAYGM